jgi:adenine nucleotide transporter 17
VALLPGSARLEGSCADPPCLQCVATIATYPLQLAQSRLRADKGKEGNAKERNYNSTADVLGKVYKAEGFNGLFKGLESKLYQTVLTAAFQMLTYEQTQRIVFALLLGDQKVVKAAH